MERLHLNDFCTFLGGVQTNVEPTHPWSPPTYRRAMPTLLDEHGQETQASRDAKEERRQLEDRWESERKGSYTNTRPWVCDVERFGFTLISTFHWVSMAPEPSASRD